MVNNESLGGKRFIRKRSESVHFFSADGELEGKGCLCLL